MKWLGATVAALTLLAAMGCGKTDQQGSTLPSMEEIGEKADKAIADSRAFLAKEWDQFAAATEGQLAQLQDKMDDLKVLAEQQGDMARAKYDEMRPGLDAKVAAAKEQLARARNAGADSWNDVKAGVQDALADLQRAYDKAASELRTEHTAAP